MSLKFSEPKSINIGNLKKIAIKTEDGKPVYVRTEKCHSFGVKKDKKFKTTSMSSFWTKIPLRKSKTSSINAKSIWVKLFRRKFFIAWTIYGSVIVYPKFKDQTKLYGAEEGEIDPSKYDGKNCEVKAVLEIGGVILNDDKLNLQFKLYEALVHEKVYEHVRLVDMEW